MAPLDPNILTNPNSDPSLIHFDELMGCWLKNLFKELKFESDYLYCFNLLREGHLYLNLNDEQFGSLNALLKDETLECGVLKFRPYYEDLNLSEKSSCVNLYRVQRLDKHFMLHMFDNNNNDDLFMFYRLKFENHSRLKCISPLPLNKEILQRKFFEFIPRAVRCARLRFEYKIREGVPFHLFKYGAWADRLSFYLAWDEKGPDFFTAHTLSYNYGSIFLNLYVSHPDTSEELLRRVSKAQSGFFLDKDQTYEGNLANEELVENVICHGMDYIESHIALEPINDALVSYSFRQPASLFSFQCYVAAYRDITNVCYPSYSSAFEYMYRIRLQEEGEIRDGDFSIGGPIRI